MPPDRRGVQWLVEIQALRGFAVLGVIMHHMYGNLLTHPHRALDWAHARLDYWTGVDLFFAISGFVIARSLLPTLKRCPTRSRAATVVGGFWIRRAARLWPSAWLWLAIILLASIVFNRGGFFGSIQANIWSTVCGVLNVANYRFSQAFMRYEYGASFAWWSLSLEEQFYFLLPLAAMVAGRKLSWLLLAIVALQLPFVRGVLGMFVRTDAIALGVLLALMSNDTWRRTGLVVARIPRPVTTIVVLCLLTTLGMLGTEEWTLFRFRIGSVALISVTLVFFAAQDTGRLIAEGFLRRGLVWIGTRSYALYLIHIPAMFAVREFWFRLGGANDYLQVLTAVPLMLALADMNWRWLEQPFRAYGGRVADRFVQRRLNEGNAAYVA